MIREYSNQAQIEPQGPGSVKSPSYESIVDKLISCTQHPGDESEVKNSKVFHIFRTWSVDLLLNLQSRPISEPVTDVLTI